MIDIKSLLNIANNDAADNGRTMPAIERDAEREQFERDFSVTGLFECLSQFFEDKADTWVRSESNPDAYEDNELQAAWVGWQCADSERYTPPNSAKHDVGDWVKVSDRLPTFSDSDNNSELWVFHVSGEVALLDYQELSINGKYYPYWMTKPKSTTPQPPKEQS